MPKFSLKSKEILSTCHPLLQDICNEAIKIYDFSVLEGYRGKELQEQYFKNGYSKLHFPQSKHNQIPSLAVDITPYPIDWSDISRFNMLAGIMFGIAHMQDVKLKWGGTWGNLNLKIISDFYDLPHFELILN